MACSSVSQVSTPKACGTPVSWHEAGHHGVEMLAPNSGIEFLAAAEAPSVDAMVEVADADGAWEIAKKPNRQTRVFV
jgi:hypothetical protein